MKNESIKMTEQQERLLKENESLIHWFKKKNNLHGDEWVDIIEESLVKSILNHDPSKANLSTYFSKVAKNDMLMEFRRQKNRVQLHLGSKECISDRLASEAEPTSELKERVEDILDNCTESERAVLLLIMEGYSQTEIARKLGLTRNAITYTLKNVRCRFKGGATI